MGYMMTCVADWQDPCWRYRLRRRASDTMPRSLHMSFGCSWTGVEILVDKFLAEMFGHPSRNPRRTALRRVNIFGLHNDWSANLTAFAFVLTE